MKKLIAMLALLALVHNVANAELLKNFKWDGKIVVNAMATNNADDANSDSEDKTSDVNAGVFLNAGFDITDDVDAVVSAVKCNRQYGTNSQTAAGATIDAFTFEQAYLNLKGVLGIDHKLGRQYYGDEGSIALYYGPQGLPFKYSDNGNPFSTSGVDGWTGWYKKDKLSLHAATFKTTDNDNVAATFDDIDTDVVGVAGKYDLMEMLNIGAYFYEQKMYKTAAVADLTLDIVGVKANGKIEDLKLSYYGELAKNYGRKAANLNYTGTAFLAGAKMELDLVGKWTFTGEMGIGSGDDKTTDKKCSSFTAVASDYRPGYIFSGVLGNTGLTDLTTWNLGATWNTPMFEKLTLGGKLYHFSPTVDKLDGASIGYDTYGNELNLSANWQHNENVGLMAYYGAFLVDGDYADTMLAGNDDMMTVFGAAVNVKF